MLEGKENFEYTNSEKIFLAIKDLESISFDDFKKITSKINLDDIIIPLFFPLDPEDNNKIFSENDPRYNPDHAQKFGNFGPDLLNFIFDIYNKTNPDGVEKLNYLIKNLYSSYNDEELFCDCIGYEKLFPIYEKTLINKNLNEIKENNQIKKRI